MSPILTRPVREQLEHDRVIRLLQARYKRKHEVVINPGPEHNEAVTVGELAVYPDLLLYGTGRSRKLEGTVEVETGESVNRQEAMAEWGLFSRLSVPLHVYVPGAAVDAARRLCAELQIPVAEIWTYHVNFDQARFAMAYRSPEAVRRTRTAAPAKKPAAKATAPKPKPGKARPAAARKAKAPRPSSSARPAKRPAKAKSKPAKRAGRSPKAKRR